jgi:hypothetical protein
MRRFFVSVILALAVVSFSVVAQGQQKQAEAVLNNASVVKLAKAGFKEKTIISIIYARIPNFDLSPERMIELKRNGVNENIIMAMLARQEGSEMPDDASFTDDEFFNSPLDPKSGQAGSTRDPNSANNGSGVDIFGSSTGTKARTKSRGNGNGSLENDTLTTGSATVRILRPPTEAGNGAPNKLEKTKSLTNDSIVELVEAGFSEGTIIRRIEQSPVDFDLATPKLEELRRRRVSDKILAAMKTAMGDEQPSK